jgi:predicted glycosyltransferase
MKKRVAMYWHNGRSLGHTAETAKVAHALAASGLELSLVGLSGAYRGLDLLPDSMDVVKLPAFTNYETGSGWKQTTRQGLEFDPLFAARAELSAVFLRHYAPDVFIVNHLPHGAENELVPALTQARTGLRILTLRGILFDKEKTQRLYFGPEPSRWIADHFDAIVVHTDPRIFRLEEAYDIPEDLRARLHYAGYLASSPGVTRAQARAALGVTGAEPVILASMGGGQGAMPIWKGVVDALHQRRREVGLAVLVTGPYLEPDARRALDELTAGRDWLRVVTYAPDLHSWMCGADLFIGAAGANMLGEVLTSGVNAIVIPRQLREPEQRMHAALLAERKLVRTCSLESALGGALPELIGEALRAPLSGPMEVRFDGARRYPEILARLLQERAS